MYCGTTGEKNCKCIYPKQPISALQVNLQLVLRKLFTDHGVYTALVLKSIVDHNAADTKVLLPRLLDNQKDIGDQLKPIVGDQKGEKVTNILTEHIKLAGDVITAATKKDKQLQSKILKLFENSDAVAKTLSDLNPTKLLYDDVAEMFHEHNQYVIDMTTARIKKDYKEEQRLYDSYYNEILEMSAAIYAAL